MTDVSLSHRDVTRPGHGPDVDRVGDVAGSSPPAQRLQRHRWRDPRLWLGVVLVLVSVLAGATLFARADDTVAVWAADSDLHAGMPLTSDELHSTRVHFADSSDVARYLRASEPIPPGAVAARDVAAGELVAISAVSTSGASPDRLPLAVELGGACRRTSAPATPSTSGRSRPPTPPARSDATPARCSTMSRSRRSAPRLPGGSTPPARSWSRCPHRPMSATCSTRSAGPTSSSSWWAGSRRAPVPDRTARRRRHGAVRGRAARRGGARNPPRRTPVCGCRRSAGHRQLTPGHGRRGLGPAARSRRDGRGAASA